MSKKSKILWNELNSTHAVFGFGIAVIVVYFLFILNTSTSDRYIYWLYVDCSGCLIDVIVDFVPLTALIMVFLWIVKHVRIGEKLSCMLWLFILLLICPLVYFAMPALPSTDFRHLDEVYVVGKLWRLAYWDAGSSSGAKYAFFQCDSVGLNCDAVHFIDVYRLEDKSLPTLMLDPQEHNVVVQIDSGELYKHEYQ